MAVALKIVSALVFLILISQQGFDRQNPLNACQVFDEMPVSVPHLSFCENALNAYQVFDEMPVSVPHLSFCEAFRRTLGYSYTCGVSNIKVTTRRTGTTIEGQPQYEVKITNDCPCAQSSVYFRCLGFSTVQPVNEGVLKVKGDSCLINNGRPIVKGRPVSFKYSFLQPTDLIPQRSEISC